MYTGWKVPITTGKHQLNPGRTDAVFQTQKKSTVRSFTLKKNNKSIIKKERDKNLQQFSRSKVNKHFFRKQQFLQRDADHTSETQRAFEHTKKP